MSSYRIAFELINLSIMPLWFGLLVFPKKKWVSRSIDVFFLLAALLFTINLLPGIGKAFEIVMKPTLSNVGEMLHTPWGTLCGWTHFVIGDLWVGKWIARDAANLGISRLWVTPMLILTLLFGPVGLLSYFLTKFLLKGKFGT